MGIDPTKFYAEQQEFRCRIAILPTYVPIIGTAHDGDVGHGHVVQFYDVVRMGPNRLLEVGDSQTWDGSLSFQRGGAAATGHHWSLYHSDSAVQGSGTLVATHDGSSYTFSLSEGGIYRLELRTANRAGDGSTDGMRFIRVFDPEQVTSDLFESDEINASFSIDDGGYTASVTYKPGSMSEIIPDWARIVIHVDTYFNGVKINEDAVGEPYVGVQLNGLVLEDSIVEDYINETITFKVVTPDKALARIALRGYPHIIAQPYNDTQISLTVDYPLMFADPGQTVSGVNAVAYAKSADINYPIHEVNGMSFTDPILHFLQKHSNFCQWFDVDLWQETAPYRFPLAFAASNVYDVMRGLQEKRLGVLYCDRKGTLYFAPDVRFQYDVIWGTLDPPTVMTFERKHLEVMQTTKIPFRIAQVRLTGMNGENIPFFVQYPPTPDVIGEVIQRSDMIVPDGDQYSAKATMLTWAARIYDTYNKPYDATITPIGINRELELQDMVLIVYTDAAGRRTDF